ncbi:MAG TPA: MBL fold metallo-hydrolase [Pyrinomonadaceae bacterium]|nr:MBL fold metallo-hydrolase [Pyrinomonadaceae bacterium]
MAKAVYAGYPTAFVYKEPNGRSPKIGHLLWGTWIEHQEEEQGDWAKVRIRGWDLNRQRKIGWMRKSDFQTNRVLEVYFVDVAQGDGCLVITPDDKFHLIDAGEGRNMAAFLRWKFNLAKFQGNITFENTIISHADSDHYKGFLEILKEPKIKFKNVYHNGLVERTGSDLLGRRENGFMTEIVVDDADLNAIINDPAKVGRKNYPTLMKKLRENGAAIKMLCCEDEYLPGYGQENDELKIRVLAPVPDTGDNGKRKMRWFGDNGKTKNGHSVVLKVEYKNVKILLGGDLNIPAENHLLEHYTGINPETANEQQKEELIRLARDVFQVDAAKACHHGSADFSNLFLQSLNTAATVISSGDDEPHAHPRPDAVGACGKFGRGDRPLIFSTELARSTRDLIIKANPTKKELGRTVAVYGMIDLRTDGKKVVLAQKLEQKAARGEWDFYELQDKNGVLAYKSKHEAH